VRHPCSPSPWSRWSASGAAKRSCSTSSTASCQSRHHPAPTARHRARAHPAPAEARARVRAAAGGGVVNEDADEEDRRGERCSPPPLQNLTPPCPYHPRERDVMHGLVQATGARAKASRSSVPPHAPAHAGPRHGAARPGADGDGGPHAARAQMWWCPSTSTAATPRRPTTKCTLRCVAGPRRRPRASCAAV